MHSLLDLSTRNWCLAPCNKAGLPDWPNAIDARVPGAILDDLYRAGQVPDPFYGENFRKVAWVGERVFWYRCHINAQELSAALPKTDEDQMVLQFDGIDTYGEVFWNGKSLGQVDNQFMRHRFTFSQEDISADTNTLEVRIDPVKDAFRKWFAQTERDTTCITSLFDDDRPWIRKSQMTFGWDNCPYLVAGGITLPVRLYCEPATRLTQTQWKVNDLDRHAATCRLSLKGKLVGSGDRTRIEIQGSCGESSWSGLAQVDAQGKWQTDIRVQAAKFWWPNGYGDPDLYDVAIQARDENGDVLAEEPLTIGLRTVRVITEPPQAQEVDYRIGLPESDLKDSKESIMDGACIGPWRRTPLAQPETVAVSPFAFEINGLRIFIKGFDWQAPDVLVGRITDEQIEHIIDGVLETGSNMLRAWGGGAVERESFYRLCDERGLLLWQDFFFACAVYPRDPAFLARIKPEVNDVIARLRNHTCLVAWCGDNESDMIEHDAGADPLCNPINKQIIPSALAELDWQERYYHVSSPSGGPYPRSDWGGDKRNWGPNFPHDNYAHIRQESARFISESGMKSFPSEEAIAKFIPEELRWPLDNSTWHLHWGDVDSTIREDYRLDDECVQFFGEANNLQERIQLSQFAQAYGTRLLIEQCRRRKTECGGILLWKTSDQWPGCDQGIYDSLGHRRPVFDAIREAFSPLIVSISQGFGTTEDEIQWWLVSDLNEAVTGTLTAAVVSLQTGLTRELAEIELALGSEESYLAYTFSKDEVDPEKEILIGHFAAENQKLPEQTSTWYSINPRPAFLYYQKIKAQALQHV